MKILHGVVLRLRSGQGLSRAGMALVLRSVLQEPQDEREAASFVRGACGRSIAIPR